MFQAEVYATPKPIKTAPSTVSSRPGGKCRLKAGVKESITSWKLLALHPSHLFYLVFIIPTYFLIYKTRITFH